ncbi:MAG: MmgE/PrpD family protein [Proteobacteria bacterium]|nr:MmgE/PrpD family protein [Pseudomonadota bacterium]MDA1323493.1 MmgE/PrpD family protein [Pseudomonadota bacterium]
MATEPTGILADFAAGLRLDAIPAEVRKSCKILILDALACALAGHQGEETGQLTAMAASLGRSTESSVFGGAPMTLAGATMLNGYLITAVTMCDVHRATLTHITPEVVPPAFAVAERDGASGADLLVAIAAGLEVTTRIGLGLDYPVFRKKGWHGPGVIGPFGSAAATGRLRGFDGETMARAFGLAGSQSAGTFAAWGTPTVKWHQCRAALSGLMAALLAEQDFIATKEFLTAPDGGLYNTYADGGLPELATGDLGQRWELQQIALRLWPSATALQEVLTALFNAVETNPVPFEAIESVRLGVSQTPFNMHGGFSTYKAKFEALLSAHYVAAVFLRDRALTLAQFEPACYDDAALRAFAANQVTVAHDASLKGGQCVVEILTKSGEKLSARCDFPLGAPENPVSSQQIEDKLRTYAGSVLPAANADRVIDMVNDLENLSSVPDLIALLRRS